MGLWVSFVYWAERSERQVRMRALVRAPTESYAECLRLDSSRSIDAGKAIAQHAAYCRVLAECGVEVIPLPPEPDLPDACFVEDTAVIVGDVAVICRPGAAPRRRETSAVMEHLARTHHLRWVDRGFIDGGDILLQEYTAYVGLSGRSDALGASKLERILEPLNIGVKTVPVERFVHLKLGATPLGEGEIVQLRGAFLFGTFGGAEIVEVDEPEGANVLVVEGHAIVDAVATQTRAILEERGWTVHPVEFSEFSAGDAGPSCLCLLFE